MRKHDTITELCEAFNVSTSGYHASIKRTPSRRYQNNQNLRNAMKSIHRHRHTRAYGRPRMTHALLHEGHCCSENRVVRLMRAEGLRATSRKPFRPRTTQPDHAAHPSPNLLSQATSPTALGQQLVSDITYIPTREGWLYLAVTIDLFSRAILGWKLGSSLHACLVTTALQRALDSGLVSNGAIFHSDRGCQYTAGTTRALLARAGLRQSMSAAGYCYDNVPLQKASLSPSNANSSTMPHPSSSKPKPPPPSSITWRPFTTANASMVPSAFNAPTPSSKTTSKISNHPQIKQPTLYPFPVHFFGENHPF